MLIDTIKRSFRPNIGTTILLLALIFGLQLDAARTFYWSMESETPDVYPEGSDTTPEYSRSGSNGESTRTSAVAYAGEYSIDCGGNTAWRSAVFDNPTNIPTWATPTEGAYALWWQYSGDLVSGMLIMITGKAQKTAPELDTNEGIGLRFKTPEEMIVGYGYGKDDTWGSVQRIFHLDWGDPFVLEAGEWYRWSLRWKVDSSYEVTFHVRVEDTSGNFKEDISTFTVGPWVALAFHQLLIGNDRNVSPSGWYIDEVEVYDDFEMTTGTTAVTWMGYSADEDGFINTGDWIGWVNVNSFPWVWSYSLESWMYASEVGMAGFNGTWAYLAR